MKSALANKNILFGITGSIAAYKSAECVRRLRETGATIRVAMTENAKRFITPLTMQALSGYPVHDDLFDVNAEAAMGHIELARWADVILVAPATADFLARLVYGRANDLLTTICLASPAKIMLAPAMNQGMWRAGVTQQHVQTLIKDHITIISPGEGSQACGDVGPGRMAEPQEMIKHLQDHFATQELAAHTVVVTAGPTHEAIDPVRYIANKSSGKMGYALAQAAYEAGAEVILISGPVNLSINPGIKVVPVKTAEEMLAAVMQNIASCDIFLGVAAVSDYRVETPAKQKRHKESDMMQLTLKRNPDIIATVGALKNKPYIVGFAAETENVIASAKQKRTKKGMDLIIANQVGDDLGMGCDDNTVTVIDERREYTFPKMSKSKLAKKLIDLIAQLSKR